LDKGDFVGANAAVAGVTPGVYQTAHSISTGRQQNGVYVFNNPGGARGGTGRFAVSESEGINGLPFRSANDPAWSIRSSGWDSITFATLGPAQLLGSDESGPGRGYVEARLIRAEARCTQRRARRR